MVMPRAFSSGAASIWSYALASPPNFFDRTVVIAAVRVVLPWSTCPIVPTFTCGLVRSNLLFAMIYLSTIFRLFFTIHYRFSDVLGRFGVVLEFHRVSGTTLRRGTQRGRIPEHLRQRHFRLHGLATASPIV